MQDMALKEMARFNTFDVMGFGYIDAGSKTWAMESI